MTVPRGKLVLFAVGAAVGAGIAWAIEKLGAGPAALVSGEMRGGRLHPAVQTGMRAIVKAGVNAWKDSVGGAQYFDSPSSDPGQVIVIPPRS